MDEPKNVLLVTNSTNEAEITLIKAAIQEKQKEMPIRLHLVHVIPSLPTCYFNIPSTAMLAERYYNEAEKCLTTIGAELGVEKCNQWLITGRIKNEVLRLANKLNTQFILASSTNMAELRGTSLFKKENRATATIQSINNLVRL